MPQGVRAVLVAKMRPTCVLCWAHFRQIYADGHIIIPGQCTFIEKVEQSLSYRPHLPPITRPAASHPVSTLQLHRLSYGPQAKSSVMLPISLFIFLD